MSIVAVPKVTPVTVMLESAVKLAAAIGTSSVNPNIKATANSKTLRVTNFFISIVSNIITISKS